MLGSMLENVRKKSPLIHNITNFVTANDCANILLACGASPIMADDAEEVEQITAACDGLVLNMGTLHRSAVDAMLLAGKKANALGHPVVLDPVGVGASAMRTEAAGRLLREVRFAVLRGNASEIRALFSGGGSARGVDADAADLVTGARLEPMAAFAKAQAKKLGAVIAVSGTVDIVADGERAYCIRNGHPMMSSVTGTGCQLSALTAAFLAANPETPLEAAAAAFALMGYAGEIAWGRLSAQDGNAAYRNYIIDAVFRMTPEMLEKGASYEVR